MTTEAQLSKISKNSTKNPPIPGLSLLHPSESYFLSNYRWKNRKERQNRSTKNGDMSERANRAVSESGTYI